jgi:translation initiation factor IF-3
LIHLDYNGIDHHSREGKQMDFEMVKEKVKENSADGTISCATSFRLAEELGCDLMEIGKAADALKIKIMHCQLGCF